VTAPVATPADDPTEEDQGPPPTSTPRIEQSQDNGLRPPPLPTTPTRVDPDTPPPASSAPITAPQGDTAAPGTATAPRSTQPGSTAPPAAATPTTATGAPADPKNETPAAGAEDGEGDDTKSGDDKTDDEKTDDDRSDDEKTDLQAAGLPDAAALNSLGSLASPLLNTALGVPAAALQGAGMLVPGMAGAVMPTLAALLNQLGTSPTPTAPASRISDSADTVTGMGGLAGTGAAADAARDETSSAARRIAALKEVEQKLGDVLGVSSAKTQAARETLNGIIYDVEIAIESAAVQGNTAEAQAAVIKTMRQALDKAGTVVSGAARDKMLDAAFVRQLINDYLGETDTPAGGGAASLMAARSSRPYGLPKGTAINYGGRGFPPWVYRVADAFGMEASTYSGHQEGSGLNRGIDWRPKGMSWASPEGARRMQRFANYLRSTGMMEQVIYQNPITGARVGVADGRPVGPGTSQPGYYRNDWAGHQDHIHTRQSLPIPLPAAGAVMRAI
jgi:hypothetical protein